MAFPGSDTCTTCRPTDTVSSKKTHCHGDCVFSSTSGRFQLITYNFSSAAPMYGFRLPVFLLLPGRRLSPLMAQFSFNFAPFLRNMIFLPLPDMSICFPEKERIIWDRSSGSYLPRQRTREKARLLPQFCIDSSQPNLSTRSRSATPTN